VVRKRYKWRWISQGHAMIWKILPRHQKITTHELTNYLTHTGRGPSQLIIKTSEGGKCTFFETLREPTSH